MKLGLRVLMGLVFAAAVALGAASAAHAGDIPYPNVGTQNPTTYTFTATGDTVTFSWVGSVADDTDVVGLFQNGTQVGGWVFSNQPNPGAQPQGATTTFNVTTGEQYQLAMWNQTTGDIFYSSPLSANPDSANHVYAVQAAADAVYTGSPSGIYVGFEDLTAAQGTDWDYNDSQIIVTGGLSVTPGPTPGAGLAGLALLALYGAFRLRRA